MSTQNPSCYIIIKGLDDVLAKEYGDMNTRIMAGYRLAFEQSKGIKLSKDIDDDTKNELFNFIETASKREKKNASENARKIRAVSDSRIFRDLNKKFGVSFNDRISMVARIISARVSDYSKANPTLTRQEIIEQVGLLNLVKDARDIIVGMFNAAKNNKDRFKQAELLKVLNNWSALVYMSQPILKQFEDVNVDITTDFVEEANEGNYNDNDIDFNYEEAVRESYQINRDKESSFGTIGKNVRRALSRMPLYNNEGILERDYLGVAKTMPAIKVHQMLLDILRNVSSSIQMEQVLKDYAVDNAWVNSLVQEIANDPLLKTRLFVDLCNNFQIYSDQKTKDGKVKTRILNLGDSKRQYNRYTASILLGNFTKNSIFRKDKECNIVLNEAPIHVLVDIVKRNFTVDKTEQEKWEKERDEWNKGNYSIFSKRPVRPKSEFEKKKKVNQVILLSNILSEHLGLSVDADMLNVLLNNRKDTKDLIESINELCTYSLNKIPNFNIDASSFLNNADFKEKINKILKVLSKYNNGLALDSRVRYKGNTYYSNVTPSYLGDFIGYIQNCAKNENKSALSQFLENKFLHCPMFKHPYDGAILNTWVRDLYNSDFDNSSSFANNISWKKGLGIDDVDFEDFGENQHIRYIMSEFHSERDIKEANNIKYISKEEFNNPNFKKESNVIYYIEGTNKAFRFNKRYNANNGWEEIDRNDYAWYPCFVMGDANVAKFIKARRYSKNEIIDGFYNIYLSELQRQYETKKLKDEWERNGISPNENMLKHVDKFCMLPFLNETYKGSHSKYYDIANSNRWQPYAIKQAIEEYLKDTSKEFTDKMLAKKNINENEVDRATDFFYNTSFATLNQLQLMTVDVAFYANMKDLQKRYKEIHAPGSRLDIHAVDPWNNNNPILSKEDPTEKVVYFKEVVTDSKETDSDFYKALVGAFGENDWRTIKYTRNKSTDGQGYRSFSSYRKVMIMSGKWDNDCQRAYETIMAIRSNMKSEGRKTPTVEELKELDNCYITFQPIKPYLYGLETIQGSNMLIPVQHKYAEVPLIPELLPEGSKIRELAEFLEDESNGIDLACSTEVVKVGEYGSVDITSDINNLKNAIIHKLNYSDFRIQTNVPNHIYHSRLFGTQFRKLILSNLRRERYDDYIDSDGVVITKAGEKIPLTKSNLIKFYNSLVVANILDSFKEFKKIAGDKYKLSQYAIHQILNNDRLINDDILALSINEFNDFVIPLFEGGLEHDAASMLFSIYKKIVNKQSILGGSAVQVSDFGITGKSESDHLKFVTEEVNGKTNIKYAECEIPFNFSYTNSKGEEVKLNFTDYCNPDGTFIMVENQTKIEKEFPGILDIIAYRIPTERAYSMMNLKVVRCSHPMAGGTIKVPSQGPTIAGFDFKQHWSH